MRISKLGILYDTKQNGKDLDKIFTVLYSQFEFWVECGEKLPISVKDENVNLSQQDKDHILNKLKSQGLTVEIEYESEYVICYKLTELD